MPGTAMLSVEGVLANHKEQPINQGLLLYHSLRTQYSVVLVTEWEYERAEHWVKGHGITGYSQMLGRSGLDVGVSLRRWQLHRLRSGGAVVDLVIDSNPLVIAMAMYEGAPGLLFAHPFYMRPEMRPDSPRRPRPWDEVQAEMQRQQEQYEDDERRRHPE